MDAKSTDEFISFVFQQSLSPKFGLSETLSESLSPNEKKRLHFLADLWSQSKLRLIESPSERLIQKAK